MERFSDMPNDYKIAKVKRDSTQKIQEPHVHPYYEIFYLINGDCTFFLNHSIYKLDKGDIVIVPQGAIHNATYPEHGSSERFVVSFRKSNLSWLDDVLGSDVVQETMECGVVSIPERRRDYVEGILDKLLFENDGPDVLSPAFIRTGLAELFLFIIRCHRFEQNVIREVDVDNRLMQEIATYIYQNYDKKLTLEDMSEKFNISRSYLSKKFKVITGFGFKEYVVNVRIQNACRLLLETNKSITDIAFECGFNDSNYFGDAFRHVKGVSPNKYRKQSENV
jgi:AraC-like DNA-binding protein